MKDETYLDYRREAYQRMREVMPEIDQIIRDMGRAGFDPKGAIVLPAARSKACTPPTKS